MKAKLKETGELINIADYTRITLDKCDSYGNPIEIGFDDIQSIYEDDGLILGMPKFTPSNILEVNDSTDWQQVRINAAIAAMQGLYANPNYWIIHNAKYSYGDLAKSAVMAANALIGKLKKE